MDGGARRIDFQPAYDPPLQARDLIAERAEPSSKQHVLFEAITAALSCDHLVLKRRNVQLGWMPKHDIQCFICDRVRVREDELIQSRKRRCDRSGIADPRKPSRLIELGFGHLRLPPLRSEQYC